MSLSKTHTASSDQPGTHRSGMLSNQDLEILWVARTLTNIYVQYESELVKLEQSDIPEGLKDSVKQAIMSKYQERRTSYANLLEQLKKKQHS